MIIVKPDQWLFLLQKIASPDNNITDKDWKNIFSFQQLQTDQCKDIMMTSADGPYLSTQRYY